MEPNDARLYQIFASKDESLFREAKSILERNNIKNFSGGGDLNNPGYSEYFIQVFGRDKDTVDMLMKSLGGRYVSPDALNKNKKKFATIVIMFVALLILFISGLITFLMMM